MARRKKMPLATRAQDRGRGRTLAAGAAPVAPGPPPLDPPRRRAWLLVPAILLEAAWIVALLWIALRP